MTHPVNHVRSETEALATHNTRFQGCSSTILGRIQRVAEEVLAKLSLLMGMDKDGLKMLHREMKQAVRMNYYPTCSRPDLVHGRAVTNEEEARMSVLTAVLPYKVEIGPVETMVNDDRSRVHRNIKFIDYLSQYLDRKMENKAHTEILKL
ncbi:hypothetical protein WN943_018042 [Citrus x changshan-huyou]